MSDQNDKTEVRHIHAVELQYPGCIKSYGLPENFNPNDYPPVRLREKRYQNAHEQSETERKRRSKNRLSQRRSTGPVSADEVDQAVYLDPYNNHTAAIVR